MFLPQSPASGRAFLLQLVSSSRRLLRSIRLCPLDVSSRPPFLCKTAGRHISSQAPSLVTCILNLILKRPAKRFCEIAGHLVKFRILDHSYSTLTTWTFILVGLSTLGVTSVDSELPSERNSGRDGILSIPAIRRTTILDWMHVRTTERPHVMKGIAHSRNLGTASGPSLEERAVRKVHRA